MVSVRVSRNYRVRCVARIDLPFPAHLVWQQLNPWSIAATWDPFHQRIVELDGENRVGGRIIIDHRFGGLCISRVGRLLKLEPEREFAFSDLSCISAGRRFPHVYRYILSAKPDGSSQLDIQVKGRWTFRIGQPLVSLWLKWVMIQIKMRMRWELTSRLLKQEIRTSKEDLPRRAEAEEFAGEGS